MKYLKEYKEEIIDPFGEEYVDESDFIETSRRYEFNIGDLVKLKNTSKYYYQAPDVYGKIVYLSSYNEDEEIYWWDIRWDTGGKNQYRAGIDILISKDCYREEVNETIDLFDDWDEEEVEPYMEKYKIIGVTDVWYRGMYIVKEVLDDRVILYDGYVYHCNVDNLKKRHITDKQLGMVKNNKYPVHITKPSAFGSLTFKPVFFRDLPTELKEKL